MIKLEYQDRKWYFNFIPPPKKIPKIQTSSVYIRHTLRYENDSSHESERFLRKFTVSSRTVFFSEVDSYERYGGWWAKVDGQSWLWFSGGIKRPITTAPFYHRSTVLDLKNLIWMRRTLLRANNVLELVNVYRLLLG